MPDSTLTLYAVRENQKSGKASETTCDLMDKKRIINGRTCYDFAST